MTETSNGLVSLAASATFGSASQLLTLAYGSNTHPFLESRTYNNLLQLTQLSMNGGMEMQYIYNTGHNNGRVTQTIDGALNETVNYTYDNLHRLLTATATNNAWGEAYSYDGFGNLTAKTPTVGSAPAYASSGNSITNSPGAADANGDVLYGGTFPNAGWDVENRLATSQQPGSRDTLSYVYDPWGRRVWKLDYNTVGATNIEVYFYGTNGKVLETYGGQVQTQGLNDLAFEGINTYFAGRMLSEKGVYVVTDRLGSVRSDSNGVQMSYFPWGEERTSTPDGRTKFAGYFRDGIGQDYANARYYSATTGGFWSPDPGGTETADPTNPTRWTRYPYASDDPVNRIDPGGADDCPVDTCVLVSDTPYYAAFWGITGSVKGQAYFNLLDASIADVEGPDHAYARSSLAGLSKAKNALKALSQESLSSKTCGADLSDVGVSAEQVTAEASAILNAPNGGDLFDGVSSQTNVTSDKFQGDIVDSGFSTVGAYFQAHDSTGDLTSALSQSNGGLATWINTAWADTVSLGTLEATLLHEILHKISNAGLQGDGPLALALGFASGANSGIISSKLYSDCFGGNK